MVGEYYQSMAMLAGYAPYLGVKLEVRKWTLGEGVTLPSWERAFSAKHHTNQKP